MNITTVKAYLKHTKLTPLEKAEFEIRDRIGIASLKESFEEKIPCIRYFFRISILIFIGCIIYYTYGIIKTWAAHQYIDKFTDIIDPQSMPMPNVTVCAEVYVNETFIKNNISLPTEIANQFEKETNKNASELIHQLVFYLARTSRIRIFTPGMKKYFRLLYEANPQLIDYASFLRAALPECKNMLKNCKINGRSFYCCERAWQLVDDGGVCYQLGVSTFTFFVDMKEPKIGHDPNAVQRSKSTISQEKEGPNYGLTFDAKINLKDVLSIDDDTAHGFKIYVHPAAVLPLLSPLTAPGGTETFIKVGASERVLTTNCVHSDQLPKLLERSYYDISGFYCTTDGIAKAVAFAFATCEMPYAQYWPNASTVCLPDVVMLGEALLQGVYQYDEKTFSKKRLEQLHKFLRGMALNLQCPKQCRYWDYSASASFIELETKLQIRNADSNQMFSRVHVSFASFSYREHKETLAMPWYLSFCNFGFVINLYLGMSFITIFEIVFYVGQYLIFYHRDWRKKRNNRVIPIKVRKK